MKHDYLFFIGLTFKSDDVVFSEQIKELLDKALEAQEDFSVTTYPVITITKSENETNPPRPSEPTVGKPGYDSPHRT